MINRGDSMFNEREKVSNKIETLIGEQCAIIGSLKGSGLLKIDGSIDGDINWLDDIILGITSYCKSNISCHNAFISGKIDGNVLCEDTLTIESSGKITGDITVKNLIIKEGGSFDGKCTMVTSKTSAEFLE